MPPHTSTPEGSSSALAPNTRERHPRPPFGRRKTKARRKETSHRAGLPPPFPLVEPAEASARPRAQHAFSPWDTEAGLCGVDRQVRGLGQERPSPPRPSLRSNAPSAHSPGPGRLPKCGAGSAGAGVGDSVPSLGCPDSLVALG